MATSKYNEHTPSRKNNKIFITDWAFKEGVFLSPNGKFIARIKEGGHFKTLSQHDDEESAKVAYNNFKK